MSGSRKRSSKWDLKEESQSPFENVQDSTWPGKAGIPLHDKESQCDWLSSGANGGNRSKWSAMEPLPGRRSSRRDSSIDENRSRTLKALAAWDRDDSYGTRMSPGLDEWRQQNCSPKNEWKKSRRSRSRSRSHSQSRAWSRSRSRSPVRGFRRESGAYDRIRGRSGASTQLCKDFSVGRCRRGNQCHFLHEGTPGYEDGWERQRKTSSKYSVPHDSREYPIGNESRRYAHLSGSDLPTKGFTKEVIRERDNGRSHKRASPDRCGQRETRRVSDVPCRYFAIGQCRSGNHCRFSHHCQTHASPDRRSRDGRWPLCQSSDDVEKLWDGPKWSDTNTSDAAKLSENKSEKMNAPEPRLTTWPVNDRWGLTLDENKKQCEQPKMVEGEKKDSLHWRAGNAGDNIHVSEQSANESWLGDMEMSPDWKYKVQLSNHVDKRQHSPLPSSEPAITQEPSGRVHDATAVMPPMTNESSSIQQEYNLRKAGLCALSSNNKCMIGKTDSSHISISANNVAAQSFSQSALSSNSLPLPSMNGVGQSEVAIPTDPSRGVSIINPQNQTPFLEGKAMNPTIADVSASQLKPGIPSVQSMVRSEEFTQLTNLSVSLAQLLANGQQLPQLYAAHSINNSKNTPSFANSEDRVKLDSAVTLQPGLGVAPQNQYDPIYDSFEPEKHDTCSNTASLSSNVIGQKNIADDKLETLPRNFSPSFLGSADNGAYNMSHGLEQMPNNKVFQLDKPEAGANSEVARENHVVGAEESRKTQEHKTAQENSSLEDIDGDGKADEGKKSKDGKGIRAFKFALVESVKELLKPTWKEGQMSKDAYKNIVKKVVDKVTGTMQGANIPQTQEKIEQYLSISKPKLTKLIQAYVEKFQKDK